MEILRSKPSSQPVKAVLLDFDGTISTLRCGWEEVMAPLMIEHLGPDSEQMVHTYIDESTGTQTIHQMKWVAQQVAARGGQAQDPWVYKDEYNRRLMLKVEQKVAALENGELPAEQFLMAGSLAFLQALKKRGVALHVASGTDHPDVMREAGALGVLPLFTSVNGAPVRQEACSKEKVMRDLVQSQGLKGDTVCVIGDGKVEISLGYEMGARCLGIASDEQARSGVNPVKRARLIAAGAEAIAGDFSDLQQLMAWMNLEEDKW